MLINDLFVSVQGEGVACGLLTFFVRTARCNLKCSWCDTKFQDPATKMTVASIIGEIERSGVRSVCITGGEPLLEKDYPLLEEWLVKAGYYAIVETNGSVSIQDVRCCASMDIKPPSSGMADKFLKENLRYLKPFDQVKFVVADEKDYEYAKKMMEGIECGIVFMPVWDSEHKIAKELSRWIIQDKLNVRLSLQVNKILQLK